MLKQCVTCKRFKERPIKLNQSPYRDIRIDPPSVPFRSIYLDYLGPFMVKRKDSKSKVWLLCFTCMWCRAVNLEVCDNLSVQEFLRAFQLHSFKFGIPQLCISDLGSQITAAANIVTDFIKDADTQLYFSETGVKSLKFEQFCKGRSELGSLVEVCVKMVKRLIFGAIKNCSLPKNDFDFLIAETVHIINRRPIAFKEGLRDSSGDAVPEPITPELLMKGFELTSVNIIPDLQVSDDTDTEWHKIAMPTITDAYQKLKIVRSRLREIYLSEFLSTLATQATDRPNRYVLVQHKVLNEGDVVLIKEVNTKPHNYPLAIVKSVQKNINDEVTSATLKKGKTRELTKRHVSTLIPVLQLANSNENENQEYLVSAPVPARVQRKAALESEKLTRSILTEF